VATYYSIRHVTRFSYETPVSESLMEVRMQPRSEGAQRCLRFELGVTPRARVLAYLDHMGNSVHHFDTPPRHAELSITARAHVQMDFMPAVPEAIDPSAWADLDSWVARGDYWDFLQPSRFAVWTPSLNAYVESLRLRRSDGVDPLTAMRTLMAAVFADFEYVPKSTRVDSPIDEALAARRGVCQDFAHIMIAAGRHLGVPCRYVSGYMASRPHEVRDELVASATHAWVEVMLPAIGWIGLDPTNNIEAGLRHIRVAVGRDYADVPPTRGVFKGGARSTLAVAVEVSPSDAPTALEPMLPEPQWAIEEVAPLADADIERDNQSQQQQQQQARSVGS
jgi:transglutaminase-like putative cysteine protease